MSILQEMSFESGLLKVDVRGEFSLDEAKRAFLEVLEAVARYQARRILLDGRTMKGEPADLERFYYGEFAANETVRLIKEHKIVPQFAYVFNVPLRDPRRFGETVAVNRGMNIKIFETPEDAFEWLGLTSTQKPDTGDS